MRQYTLTAYLDSVKVGFGTVLEDHPIEYLVEQANDWFGKDNWNVLKLKFIKRPQNEYHHRTTGYTRSNTTVVSTT